VNELDHPWADAVSDIGRFYQNEYVTIGAAGLFYAYGTLRGQAKIRRIGTEIIEAFALSGAGSGLLKHLVGRDRPSVERGPYHFVGPNCHDKHQSFLSGNAILYLNHRRNVESGKLPSDAQCIHITFTNLADSAPGVGVVFGF
jgi:hypothetical protein